MVLGLDSNIFPNLRWPHGLLADGLQQKVQGFPVGRGTDVVRANYETSRDAFWAFDHNRFRWDHLVHHLLIGELESADKHPGGKGRPPTPGYLTNNDEDKTGTFLRPQALPASASLRDRSPQIDRSNRKVPFLALATIPAK
jgi:hypothetical protein